LGGVGGFYARAMAAADQLELAAAAELEGVREEIALVRVKLAELAGDPEGDPEVFAKLVETLGKLVAIDFRLSGNAGKGLSENLAAVLRSLGELTDARGG